MENNIILCSNQQLMKENITDTTEAYCTPPCPQQQCMTSCLSTLWPAFFIVRPKCLPIWWVKNDEAIFFKLSLEFLRIDNTWRRSFQRNTAPKEVKYWLKIHDKFIKIENEKISTYMYISESEYSFGLWSLNDGFGCFPQGNQGRLSFDKVLVMIWIVIAMYLFFPDNIIPTMSSGY